MLRELGFCVCLSSFLCRINLLYQRFVDRGNVLEVDGNIICESWINLQKIVVKDIIYIVVVLYSEIVREDSDFSGMEQIECKIV